VTSGAEQAKAVSMPAQHGLGLDQKDSAPPVANETREEYHKASLVRFELGLSDRPTGNDELLAKKRVFGEQLIARPERIHDQAAEDRRWPRPGTNCGARSSERARNDTSRASRNRQHRA
jgi:hypothetical protein